MGTKSATRQKIEPLGDRVLIRLAEAPDKSAGGLYIPEMARDTPQIAEVVAVGPGHVTDTGILVPMRIKVGERVLVGKYSGMKFTVDDEELTMVRETDIVGRVIED